MHLVRFADSKGNIEVGVKTPEGIHRIGNTISELLGLTLSDFRHQLEQSFDSAIFQGEVSLLAPVDGLTELWAAGVTYERSRDARVEESIDGDIYTRVYQAERPELFFKSTAWRVVTDGEPIGVRLDSELNVPEPELAVVANRYGEIVGYAVCDDVSSRSIEGDNPLYLPQAKIYAGSCALSAGIRPAWEVGDPQKLRISVVVLRNGEVAWSSETSTASMRRRPDELVAALFDHDQFPAGAIISTGTGIVPELNFNLQSDDVVSITIDDIGNLSNSVMCGKIGFGFLSRRLGKA